MPPSPEHRFLADENLDWRVVKGLRRKGCDVKLTPKGLRNGAVLRMAILEGRVLITNDRDFTDPFRYPPDKTRGIIVVKIHPPLETDILAAFEKLLAHPPDAFSGRLILLTKTGYVIE